MVFETHSPQETQALGERLGRILQAGDVVSLVGELGAGKTCFVRGLVRGLGGSPRAVSSPTFVLLNVYDGGRLTVYHLDAYRVGAEDLEAIGFSELLDQGGVVVVEWARRVAELLPPTRIHVCIEATAEEGRRIEVERRTGGGARPEGA